MTEITEDVNIGVGRRATGRGFGIRVGEMVATTRLDSGDPDPDAGDEGQDAGEVLDFVRTGGGGIRDDADAYISDMLNFWELQSSTHISGGALTGVCRPPCLRLRFSASLSCNRTVENLFGEPPLR